MPKTSQELGLWIKNNEDRKGSSDFNTMVDAWKKAKERENNPYNTTKKNGFSGSGVFDEQVLGKKPVVQKGFEHGWNAVKRGGHRVLSTADLIKSGSQLSDYNRSQGSKQDILKGMFDKQFGSTYGMQWDPSWQTPQDVFNGIQGRASDIGVSSVVNSQLISFTERYNNMTAEWEKNQDDGGASKLDDAITSFQDYKGHLDKASEIPSSISGQDFTKVLTKNKKEDENEETGLKGFWNGTKTFWRSIGEDPSGAAAFIAETAAESLPVMAASIGTTLLTRNPVLGSLVMATGAVSQEAGSTAMAYLKEQGIPMDTREDALAVLKNHDLLAEANRKGFGKGLVVAAFELLGQGAVARTYYKANKAANVDPSLLSKIVAKTKTGTKSSLIQGAAGGGGEAASQIAIGEKVDASDVWIEALAEIATGPAEAVVAGASLAKNEISTPYTAGETDGSLTSEFKSEEDLTSNETKAYSSLALELNDIAKEGGLDGVPFDLMDVDAQSKKGAKTVIDNTHNKLVGFMNRYFGELTAKGGPLNKKGKTEAEVDLITLALIAKAEGRNKVKGQVSKESYDALEALVGNTKEGQNLIRTLMQLDALTQLDGKGLQGGLSEFTDKFSILGRVGGKDSGFSGATARLKPLLTGMAAAGTTGASLIPQAILPGLGRYIDKKRGTYSVLDKYIKDNIKGDPLDAATGPSVVAAKQLEEQTKLRNKRLGNLNKRLEKAKVNTAQRETAKSSFENAEPATPGSPQYVLEQALGVRESDLGATPYQPVKEITPQVLVDLLEIVKAENETSLNSDTSKEVFKKAVEEYQKSIIEGGTIENDMLSPVIRKVVSMAEKQGVIKRRTTPNSPGPSNTQLETPAISRGIADNQAVLADLTKRAKENSSVEPYRAPLEEALNNLGLNLGTDPVSAATDIVNKAAADGVPNKAIKSYLRPYVDRIVRQAIQSRTNQFQGEGLEKYSQEAINDIKSGKIKPFSRESDGKAEAIRKNVSPEAAEAYIETFKLESQKRLEERQKERNNIPPVVDQTTPVLDQTTDNSTTLNQYKNLFKRNDVLPRAPKFDKPSGTVESEVEFNAPADPVETRLNLIKEPGNKAQIKLRGDKIDAITGMSLEALEAMTDDQMLQMTPVEYNHYQKIHVDRLREETGLGPLDNASEKPTEAQSKAATKEFNKLYPDPTIESQGKTREARVMPIPNKKSYLADFTVKVAIDPEVFDGEKTGTKGRYIDRDTGADLTGKTFAGANINTIDGPGNMETSDTEVEISDERIPGAYTYRANLIQNRNGKKWSWVNNNTNQITHEEGIVSVQGGKDSKHFYTFDYQIETPVTMDAVKTGQVENSVVLKPKTKGNMVLGNELGKIKVPGGGIHTVYDNIRIEPMETDSVPTPGRVAESKVPALTNINEPLKGTGKKGSITISDVVSHLQTKAEAEGKKAPRTLSGGKETNKVDYTPEVKDRIYNDIKNEVLGFKEQKPDSLYWYTFGSPIAMDMMTYVIPQLDPQHSHPDSGQPLRMLFWALISPLSGGQNPVANAKLAIDVMRGYIDTGRIPLHKYQGGLFINDETVAEREAAGGKLAWTPRGRTTENALAAIQNGIDQTGSLRNFMKWMTSPHPIQEVRDAYESYGFGTLKRNKDGSYAANLGSMSDAYADADGMVYGSQVLGPKFGPFMLNNTGNESKSTKDEWFTRGWNRIIGRLYAPNGDILSQPADANERAIQDEITARIAEELGHESAQIQALWWAYEQNLYTNLGVNSPTRDYIDAAKEAIKAVSGEAQAIEREREGRARFSELSAQERRRGQGEGVTRQSRGPALTSPEGNQPRTNPPSVRRLKPYVEPAKTAFEIGKPGSKYEDGIGTLGEALELARALNLTVTFLNEMAKGQTGEYAGMADVKGADGLIRSTTKGNVRVLKKGSDHPMFTGQQITSVKEFTSLMHEIAHGLAIERTDRVPSTQYRQAKNEFVLAEQALETVKVGSFEDFILDAMENYESQGEVLKEIVNLQENIDVEIARKPQLGTTGVRPIRQVAEYIKSNPALRSRIDENKLQELNNKFRRTYLSTVAEMAVDPLWVYLINPKLLKKVAPNTATAIRYVFSKVGGDKNPVTFYSYPLATIMAIVMGVLANLEEEEEKRNAQPPPLPPGVLSPDMSMGALSA